MDFFQSAILGTVQGLTEFIPVSSSGHLELIPRVFGWKSPSTAFDTFLHIGTLLALLIFYRVLILRYIKALIAKFQNKADKEQRRDYKVIVNIILATIPAAILGVLLEKTISGFYDNNANNDIAALMTIIAMIVMGTIFLIAHKHFRRKKIQMDDLTAKQSLFIGFSQALAFFRGVSRSGITLLSGQLVGLERVAAAEFVFLMSIPIIGATSIYSVYSLIKTPTDFGSDFASAMVGLIFAFVFGLIAINFLINFLKKNSLFYFGIYRIAFALICFIIIFGFK